MKRLLMCLSVVVVFLIPVSGSAQSTTAAQPTSEQSLQELVAEVRQLRAMLQRMNVAAYKGQVMLERLKLQQEQVNRLSRELRDTRETLGEVRAQQARVREVLGRVEAEIQSGVQREAERTNLKAELGMLSQRQQRMMMRETQIAAELQGEHAKLNELNHKLNVLIEQEMSPR